MYKICIMKWGTFLRQGNNKCVAAASYATAAISTYANARVARLMPFAAD